MIERKPTYEELIKENEILKQQLAEKEEIENYLKNAKLTLTESEQYFKQSLSDSPIVVFRQDTELRYTWIHNPNPEFNPDEVIGKTDFELLSDNDAQNLTRIKQSVLQTGIATKQQVQTTINNQCFYYLLFVEAIKNQSNEIIGISCVSVDITKQTETENALKKAKEEAIASEERYRNIIENSVVTIYSFNIKTGTYDYLSPSVEDMYGYSPEEFISGGLETTITRFHPDDIKKIENHLNKLLDKELEDFSPTVEYRFKHPKKGYRWISDTRTVIYDTNNQAASLIGFSVDITEKVEAEEKLRKQNQEYISLNEKYRTQNEELKQLNDQLEKAKEKVDEAELSFKRLFNRSRDGYVINKGTGEIITPNSAYLKMLGYQNIEELNWQKVTPEKWLKWEIETHGKVLVERGYTDLYEKEYIRKDGTVFPVQVQAFLLNNPDNLEDALIAAFVRDITKQKADERELVEYQNFLSASQKVGKIGSYITDLTTNTWKISEGMYEVLGIDRSFPNTVDSFMKLVHPDCLDDFLKYFEKIFAGYLDFNYEYKIIRPVDNIESWVHGVGKFEFDKEGNPIYQIGTIQDITEKKDIELKLLIAKERAEENEEKYKRLTENSPDMIYRMSLPDGNYQYVSPGSLHIFGYTPDEFYNSPILIAKVIHSDFVEYFKTEWQKLISGDLSPTYEYMITDKKGKDKWLHQRNVLISDETGNPVAIEGIVTDMTQLKQAETDLKQKNLEYEVLNEELNRTNEKLLIKKEEFAKNEELLRLINNASIDQIYAYDLDNRFIMVNKTLCENLNLSSDEIIGKTYWDFGFPVELCKLWDKWHRETYEKGMSIQHAETPMPDGSTQYFEVNLFVIENNEGKAIGISGVNRNITKRTIAEKELIKAKEQTEEREKQLLYAQEISELGFWDLDVITGDLYWSDYTFIHYGFKPQEFTPSFEIFNKVVHPDDLPYVLENVNNALEKDIEYSIKFRFFRPNGEIRYLFTKGNVTRDTNGKALRFVGTQIDVTETVQNELKLKEAKEKAEESDRLKTEFINNMSHEIRTPMNGILGFSKLLNKKNLSTEKRKHYISIIRNSGNQLMRIIDDILEISKLGTKQVKVTEKEICLNDLLLEHFSIFDIKAKENKTPLYLKKGLSDSESTIFIDETKLNKILSNLIENALKFTNDGFIEIGYKLKGKYLEIYVKDTGIGIAKDKQRIIFERFSQEEKELSKNVGGLGLGLSIAKENTELLGGKITLQSEKGKGATFIISIPYKPVNQNSKTDFEEGRIFEEQDIYEILIVEDEEINYLFLEALIVDEIDIKCNIHHVKNGKEAVEICQNNHEIRLILMDLKMPVMNGFEATKLIKAFKPELPIIAQTAYTTNEDKEKALSAGCDDFISKPINEEVLNELMNKFLITN